jgi:hypothetical protein
VLASIIGKSIRFHQAERVDLRALRARCLMRRTVRTSHRTAQRDAVARHRGRR